MKQDLDHHIWKILKAHELQSQGILVALSGGLDSVALLVSLRKVHKKIEAAYFHHGESETNEQSRHRDEAALFCEKLCRRLDVPFHLLKNSRFSKSEADLREQRYAALKKCLSQQKLDLLAFGHHRDDLLETRMLRLIRGTGGQGLGAMEVYREVFLRPLLEVSKKELRSYLSAEKIRSLKDPSNKSTDPLRNWLREDWFRSLERKQKGSLRSLARSLETLALEIEKQPKWDLLSQNEAYSPPGSLSRSFYLSLNRTEQKRLLAQYLLSLGKKNFTQAHLEEIAKRLDNSQKVIMFRVAQQEWLINAEQIKVQS